MTPQEKIDLLIEIENALADIRPHLVVDGGDVEVVDIDEAGVLYIKWLGNCESCNMSVFTMKAGLEQAVCSKVPRVKSVSAVNGVMAS